MEDGAGEEARGPRGRKGARGAAGKGLGGEASQGLRTTPSTALRSPGPRLSADVRGLVLTLVSPAPTHFSLCAHVCALCASGGVCPHEHRMAARVHMLYARHHVNTWSYMCKEPDVGSAPGMTGGGPGRGGGGAGGGLGWGGPRWRQRPRSYENPPLCSEVARTPQINPAHRPRSPAGLP